MGLRSRILGLLARGDPGEADPDALVELEVVPLSIGPMRVVMVRGADLAAARETLKRMFGDDERS